MRCGNNADIWWIGKGTKNRTKGLNSSKHHFKRHIYTHGRKKEHSENQTHYLRLGEHKQQATTYKEKGNIHLSHGHKSPLAAEGVGNVSHGLTRFHNSNTKKQKNR